MAPNDTISIRALTQDDLELFKAMRTKAILNTQDNYCGKYSNLGAYSEETWQKALDRKGKEIFGLFDGETLIGITGIFRYKKDPSGQSAIFAISYIEPDYRRRGLADMLYKARMEWALKSDYKILINGHRISNEASKRAMIKHGFGLTHSEEVDWPNGDRDAICWYSLDLEKLRSVGS